jgi:hypothetical protein
MVTTLGTKSSLVVHEKLRFDFGPELDLRFFFKKFPRHFQATFSAKRSLVVKDEVEFKLEFNFGPEFKFEFFFFRFFFVFLFL